MTSVDFVMTVAVGSLLASAAQATEWQALTQIMTVMAALFALQVIFAWLRGISPRVGAVIQNTPVLLMRDGKILEQRLADHRVARADLIAKLREANVTDFSQVRAVVLETTGDVSVLHGAQLDEALLEGVRT
jgi:uncharacterized membrane protein YcaP (DUF421 family)